MTYGNTLPDCRENCRDILLTPVAMKLQPFKSAFYSLWLRVNVALRDHDATVPGDAHDGEGVHSRFSESSKHCIAQRAEYKISAPKIGRRLPSTTGGATSQLVRYCFPFSLANTI